MHYHLLLTELCNSKCRYCYEKSLKEFDNQLDKKFKFDFKSPSKTQINVRNLKKFLSKDKNPVLVFYGGEPLLEIEKIKEIIDNINIPLRMQTNGKLLHELPSEYLNKIDKLLVSLDGTEERTDYNRGKGTYRQVINNIQLTKTNGYCGEIVARMTIETFSDICEQVQHLVKIGFTSIHWQLDAGFYKFDFNKESFEKFAREYNKSISKLAEFWINEMEKGKVLKLYPFMAIIDSLLKNEKTKLRCGAGYAGYAITTNGKVMACPIMNCVEDFKAGTLETPPKELIKFSIDECNGCEEKDLCGGRCMYWRKAKLWPKEGDDLICQTVKHLIKELKSKLPKIKSLIEKDKIKQSDFDYEKYFGPEIIP